MIAGTFNEWFTLQHKSQSDDGQGGITFAYATYASERGRSSHLGRGSSKSEETRFGAQLQERVTHLIYFRPGLFGEVIKGDRVIDESATNYEVMAVRAPSAKPRRHIEVECREVQVGE